MNNSSDNYHFGLPGHLIWILHIILGLLITYIGYRTLNNKNINQILALILIVMGVLAIVYHAHIWFTHIYY